MADLWWLMSVAALSGALAGGWLLVRRHGRARAAADSEARTREAARRAVAQLAKSSRRKGTIRGKGGGGDRQTAHDAATGTDFTGA